MISEPFSDYSFVKFLHDANTLPSEPERITARQEGVERLFAKNGLAAGAFSRIFNHHFSDEEVTKLGSRNCQNIIGEVSVPLAVAGPVHVHARTEKVVLDQEVLIPLATTEGALVPSIQRGCKAISQSGGARVLVEQKGMTRAPVFRCKDGHAAQQFLEWMQQQSESFQAAAGQISSHLRFVDMQGWIVGRQVFLRCRYDADQAMGMNMVTLAVQKAWDELGKPLKAVHPECEAELIALSSNVCTDKKQAAINQLLGRGWWAQAEVMIPHQVIPEVLRTTAERIVEAHVAKNLVGSYVAGHAAQNMQIANVAAAVYLATGQDLAHVVDVSQGMTTLEKTDKGLYAAVTLPTVPAGVVGGGSWLPAQTAARQLILGTPPTAQQLVAVTAVAALAAELSGMAALASHDLARAHSQFGRSQKESP